MNKFQITLSLITLGIIGILFFFLQGSIDRSQIQNTNKGILPTDSSAFQPIVNQQREQQPQQQAPQPTEVYGVDAPAPASVSATIKTSKGNIQLTLYGDKAPNTVKNFINKAKSGFYKNLTFHRVEDWVIQGGDPLGNGAGGGQILTEINDLPFVTGSLGVARGSSNPQISNDSQFFITKQDSHHLDGQYTNFGTVREGFDIVNKIQINDKILDVIVE